MATPVAAIMADIGASVTGNVESALLEIEDLREMAGSSAAAAGGMAMTASVLSGGTSSLVNNILGAKKTFKLQFNPSELQINANAPPFRRLDAQRDDGIPRSYADSPLPASISLSTQFYFDDVNIFDAFMWDKYNGIMRGNPTFIAKDAASLAMAASGRKWTVQTEVEGIISALRNPYTRSITFRWSTFSFCGTLKSVNARYTMFSPSGRPIRAVVGIRLVQKIEEGKLADWYAAFDSAFGGSQSNLVDPGGGGAGGNLLNLGLF